MQIWRTNARHRTPRETEGQRCCCLSVRLSHSTEWEVAVTHRAHTSRGSIHSVSSRGRPSWAGVRWLSWQALSSTSSQTSPLFIWMHLGGGSLESLRAWRKLVCILKHIFYCHSQFEQTESHYDYYILVNSYHCYILLVSAMQCIR